VGAGGAPLSLAFGQSLEVELRPAPGGVEILLRPEGRLAAACARAVPELVAALSRRGIGVARAEVRPRASEDRRRVDLPRGLR
jgi:hypothetical protein